MTHESARFPKKSLLHECTAAWRGLSQNALDDGQWKDGYCDTIRWQSADIDNHTRDLFRYSIDVMFSYTIWNQRLQYHAPGNLVVTALYVNWMKHIYAPAILQHVVSYMKSDHKSEAMEAFIERIQNIYLLGLRTPYLVKSRLALSITTNEYASIRREWTTGIAGARGLQHIRYSQRHYVHMPKQAPYANWRPDGIERTSKLVLAIEARFPDQNLRRGPDGCPFPFHEPQVPSDWTWWTCWRMFDERLVRMKEWCNRNWDCRF